MPHKGNSKEWARNQRNKLNKEFTNLSQYLPQFDPAKPITKLQILQDSAQFIKQLRLSNSRLLSKDQDDEKTKLINELRDEVNRLILRVKQLTALLEKAKISIPLGPSLKLTQEKLISPIVTPPKPKSPDIPVPSEPEEIPEISIMEVVPPNLTTNKEPHKTKECPVNSKSLKKAKESALKSPSKVSKPKNPPLKKSIKIAPPPKALKVANSMPACTLTATLPPPQTQMVGSIVPNFNIQPLQTYVLTQLPIQSKPTPSPLPISSFNLISTNPIESQKIAIPVINRRPPRIKWKRNRKSKKAKLMDELVALREKEKEWSASKAANESQDGEKGKEKPVPEPTPVEGSPNSDKENNAEVNKEKDASNNAAPPENEVHFDEDTAIQIQIIESDGNFPEIIIQEEEVVTEGVSENTQTPSKNTTLRNSAAKASDHESTMLSNGNEHTETSNQTSQPKVQSKGISEMSKKVPEPPPSTQNLKEIQNVSQPPSQACSKANGQHPTTTCPSIEPESMNLNENADQISECIARSIGIIDGPEIMELEGEWHDNSSPKSSMSPTQMFLSMFPLLPGRENIVTTESQNSPSSPQKNTLNYGGGRSSFFIDAMLPDESSSSNNALQTPQTEAAVSHHANSISTPNTTISSSVMQPLLNSTLPFSDLIFSSTISSTSKSQDVQATSRLPYSKNQSQTNIFNPFTGITFDESNFNLFSHHFDLNLNNIGHGVSERDNNSSLNLNFNTTNSAPIGNKKDSQNSNIFSSSSNVSHQPQSQNIHFSNNNQRESNVNANSGPNPTQLLQEDPSTNVNFFPISLSSKETPIRTSRSSSNRSAPKSNQFLSENSFQGQESSNFNFQIQTESFSIPLYNPQQSQQSNPLSTQSQPLQTTPPRQKQSKSSSSRTQQRSQQQFSSSQSQENNFNSLISTTPSRKRQYSSKRTASSSQNHSSNRQNQQQILPSLNSPNFHPFQVPQLNQFDNNTNPTRGNPPPIQLNLEPLGSNQEQIINQSNFYQSPPQGPPPPQKNFPPQSRSQQQQQQQKSPRRYPYNIDNSELIPSTSSSTPQPINSTRSVSYPPLQEPSQYTSLPKTQITIINNPPTRQPNPPQPVSKGNSTQISPNSGNNSSYNYNFYPSTIQQPGIPFNPNFAPSEYIFPIQQQQQQQQQNPPQSSPAPKKSRSSSHNINNNQTPVNWMLNHSPYPNPNTGNNSNRKSTNNNPHSNPFPVSKLVGNSHQNPVQNYNSSRSSSSNNNYYTTENLLRKNPEPPVNNVVQQQHSQVPQNQFQPQQSNMLECPNFPHQQQQQHPQQQFNPNLHFNEGQPQQYQGGQQQQQQQLINPMANQGGSSVSNFNLSSIFPEINDKRSNRNSNNCNYYGEN